MKRLRVVFGLAGLVCALIVPGCDIFMPVPPADPVAQWLDTFVTYTRGSFPPENWVRSGNADAAGNLVAWDWDVGRGEVLQLDGVYGGNWSAVAYRAVNLSDHHHFTFSVKTSDVGGVGSHRFNAAIDLMTGPDWRTSGRWLIFFGTEGNIRTSLAASPSAGEGLVLGPYELGKWYDVEITYTRMLDKVEITYYIDGAYAGTVNVDALTNELDLAYIGLWSGDTRAWFADVGVSPSGEY